jgi:hypothetical protein
VFINFETAAILKEWYLELTGRPLFVKNYQEFKNPQKEEFISMV